MGFIYDNMRAFLIGEGWPVTKIGDYPAFSMSYGGTDETWTCIAQAVEEESLLLFYSSYPLNAPEDKKEALGLFFSYANYTSLIGNFELSDENGDIRYRTSLSLKGIDEKLLAQEKLIQQLMRNVVYANVQNMDFYMPAIKAVLAGKDPAEALKALE